MEGQRQGTRRDGGRGRGPRGTQGHLGCEPHGVPPRLSPQGTGGRPVAGTQPSWAPQHARTRTGVRRSPPAAWSQTEAGFLIIWQETNSVTGHLFRSQRRWPGKHPGFPRGPRSAPPPGRAGSSGKLQCHPACLGARPGSLTPEATPGGPGPGLRPGQHPLLL